MSLAFRIPQRIAALTRVSYYDTNSKIKKETIESRARSEQRLARWGSLFQFYPSLLQLQQKVLKEKSQDRCFNDPYQRR